MIVRIINYSDAVVVYTCLFDFISFYGRKDCKQQWNECSVNHALKMLDSIHQVNMAGDPYKEGVFTRYQNCEKDWMKSMIRLE